MSGHLADDPVAVAMANALQQNLLLPRWWLSFVDPDKAPPIEQQRPGGPSWLGASIVRAPDFMSAVQIAHALGCNPGGELKGFPVPPGVLIPEEYMGRLLNHADIDYLDTLDPTPEGDQP